ncbi:MAG: hypothetical protein M0R76_09665 [Proteobacteria bacterium]|nr:hypothetical protein [Pseudomonadota bacterium]
MPRTAYLGVTALLLSFLLPTCRSQEPVQTPPPAPPDLSALVVQAQPLPPLPDETADEAELSPLARGEHCAFGVCMPAGMIPTSGPTSDIYRFEGSHGTALVRLHIEEQLRQGYQLSRSAVSRAYFISQALPQTACCGAETLATGDTLSLRVFDGSLGGAAVDIWVVSAPPTPPPSAADNSGFHATPMGRAQHPAASLQAPPRSTPPKRLVSPHERRRSFLDVTEKMARGKALSESDQHSPFFTEER